MERFNLNVYGQDVTLSIESRLYDPKNTRILRPHDYFAQGTDSNLEIILSYGKRRRALADDDFLQITNYRGRAGSHIIRQLVCYLAAYHSRAFDIVHGSGLLMDSRKSLGVLLIGAAHCGKSTLGAKLGGIVMDDDLMLVSGDTMRVAGKMGFVTYKHLESGRKYLTPLPNGVKEAHIGLVFLLDKKQEGGTYLDVDNTIPRKYARLDDLAPILKDAYLRMSPIRVEAPIFRLGTRGKLPQTLRTAEYIIDQHI
ncbi:MAG: hypothetical protein ACLQM8_12885 [Limisphaerales bacterium]|jgi:hypothetical protein